MDLVVFPEDMNVEEKASLQDYIKNGCPGLVKVSEDEVFAWFNLYISGKTYNEIAQITKGKRDLILYVAHRARWHQKRLGHLTDISSHITQKIQKAKLESANTVVNAITSLGKYYDDKFNKFLSTNDKDIIENMDTKMLGQYYKSLEILDKIAPSERESSKDSAQPTVNINIGPSKIKQKDDNTVDITPEDTDSTENTKAAKDILRALSQLQKSKENT